MGSIMGGVQSVVYVFYSPVIVADDANIEVAARRIIWGKLMNAGQSCISPDYVLCSQTVRDQLVHGMRAALVEFYGSEVLHL